MYICFIFLFFSTFLFPIADIRRNSKISLYEMYYNNTFVLSREEKLKIRQSKFRHYLFITSSFLFIFFIRFSRLFLPSKREM